MCSSYTGFDRDLIGRARVRLIPVDVSDGDDAFSPGSMDAFHAAYEQCRRDNIVVRAVVSACVIAPISSGQLIHRF